MPWYRFVIYLSEVDVEISFNREFSDDIHVRALAVAAVADADAVAEVWTDSRLVGVLDTGPDVGQALTALLPSRDRNRI